MSLRPTHAVIGTTDLERTIAFLEPFGFRLAWRATLGEGAAGVLYGLDEATEEAALVAPGSTRGWLRLVRTPHPAPATDTFSLGGHAIDLYGRDVERSRAVAEAAGASCGPIGRYRMGPLAVEELKCVGPDHLTLVVIAVDRRRPSLLDTDASRLHSEVHAAVWTVADTDEALPFWREQAGLQILFDVTVREPEVAKFMGLPRPDTRLRLAVLADADGGAPRFEMIAFPDDPGAALPQWPLRAGLHALGAESDDLAATVAALPAVRWGAVADLGAGALAVTGEAPGGVRLEVRAPSASRA